MVNLPKMWKSPLKQMLDWLSKDQCNWNVRLLQCIISGTTEEEVATMSHCYELLLFCCFGQHGSPPIATTRLVKTSPLLSIWHRQPSVGRPVAKPWWLCIWVVIEPEMCLITIVLTNTPHQERRAPWQPGAAETGRQRRRAEAEIPPSLASDSGDSAK